MSNPSSSPFSLSNKPVTGLDNVKSAAQWNNPDDVVVLKSSDGKVFRVPDYLLKTYSEVFREILGLQATGPAEIPMSEKSSIIEIFLYTLTCPDDHIKSLGYPRDGPFTHLAKVGCDTWIQLCALLDKYEVSRLQELYTTSRDRASKQDPFHAFVSACRYEQWKHAGTMLVYAQGEAITKRQPPGSPYFGVVDFPKYKGRQIGSMHPGSWDTGMMNDAGEEATLRLEKAWEIAKDRVGQTKHNLGFAGLLGDAFAEYKPESKPKPELQPPTPLAGIKRKAEDPADDSCRH